MTTTSRTLPGVGLTGGWSNGEDGWATGANANWLIASVLLQATAKDIVDAVPDSPSQGDVYILSSTASANANAIAVYDNSEWSYLTASNGYTFFVVSKSAKYLFSGSAWAQESSGASSDYKLPIASATALGGIKVGSNLSMSEDGTLSADASDGEGVVTPYLFIENTDSDRTISTSYYNIKGSVITIGADDYIVKCVGTILDVTANNVYKMAIVTFDSNYAVNTIVTSVEVTPTKTATAQYVQFVLPSSVKLTAGSTYGFLVCNTSVTTTATSLSIAGANIHTATYTGFGLSGLGVWRSTAIDIVVGASLSDSSDWANGKTLYISIIGAPTSLLAASLNELITTFSDTDPGLVPVSGAADRAKFLRGDGTWSGATVRFLTTAVNVPTASETLGMFVADTEITFPPGLTGSVCKVGTAPTASYTLTVNLNGTESATVVIGTDGTATFTAAKEISMVSGDVLSVVGAATADSTIANIALNLVGTET